jgi:hypothetical protein
MTTLSFYQTIGADGRESAIWGLRVAAATYFALSAVSIARTTPWD